MARYIDADFLIEQLQPAKNAEWNKNNYSKSISEMIEDFCTELKNTRTADVVEVVRCKDCKHFMEYSEEYHGKVESADGDCYLRLINSVDAQFQAVCCNDFCSYGKRKDDKND